MLRLHVEPTSRCTLACPKCERTDLLQRFGRKGLRVQDLDIDAFYKFVDCDVDRIMLAGNLGDPIYHPRLIELVAHFKSRGTSIQLVTNGSRKSRSWWRELNQYLTKDDTIDFSVDGTPDNFTQYRINGDWKSVRVGMEECCAGDALVSWKYIPFNYNENTIDEAREISKSIGVMDFDVTPSWRWEGDDDPWRPSNNLGLKKLGQNTSVENPHAQIVQECDNDRMHYIAASGQYVVCCYAAHYNYYYSSNWWKQKQQYNIQNTSLSECIRQAQQFRATIQDKRYNYCVANCGRCE